MKRTLVAVALFAVAPLTVIPTAFAQSQSNPGAVTPGSALGSSGSTLGAPGSTLGTQPGAATGSAAIPSTGTFNRPGDTRLPGSDTTPGISTLPGVGESGSSTGNSMPRRPEPLGSRPSQCVPGSATNPC